ncbi:MAG: phosphotransferase [Myxococcota bacterium]
MKAWDALSERGRLRRLRSVAAEALGHYAVRPRRLRRIGGFVNAVFRVDADEGVFALRVELMKGHADAHIDAEMAWLRALERDGLPTARVVPARGGDPYVHAGAPGVPEPRRCALFRWIGGRPLAASPSPATYGALGRLMAQLHHHAEGRQAAGRPMRWDRVFYWPESVDPVVIHDEAMAHHFAGGRREVLEAALETVGPAFARRARAGFRLLHGDLHPWNVHVRRGALTAFDFEDVMWAHPVQDVAITFSYLDERPDHAELCAAFEEGYRALAPWPETYAGEVAHFVAARRLMFVNFVANVRPDPSDFYAKTFPKLEAYLARWG